MKKLDIPDESFSGENLDTKPTLFVEMEGVFEWTPERDGRGRPTEVHVVFDVADGRARMIMRLKSSDAVDLFIATLMRHRNSVWGAG